MATLKFWYCPAASAGSQATASSIAPARKARRRAWGANRRCCRFIASPGRPAARGHCRTTAANCGPACIIQEKPRLAEAMAGPGSCGGRAGGILTPPEVDAPDEGVTHEQGTGQEKGTEEKAGQDAGREGRREARQAGAKGAVSPDRAAERQPDPCR